jgi:hypothetical protein
MGNVHFHFEVQEFDSRVEAYLSDRYEVACQHVQSCCILICDKKLKVNGKWTNKQTQNKNNIATPAATNEGEEGAGCTDD